MQFLYRFLFVSAVVASGCQAYSQSGGFTPKVTPPTPQAAAFSKYGDIPVGYYTGVPNISVPLYTIQEGSLSLPISLSYHASGIRVAEEASRVGLGWVLNSGGLISRTVIGEDDFEYPRYFNSSSVTPQGPQFRPNALIQSGSVAFRNTQNNGALQTFNPIIDDGNSNEYEPDQYSFNFGGYSGKFVVTRDKQIILQKHEKLQVRMIEGGSGSNGQNITWEIKTPDGTAYLFSELEFYTNTSGSTSPHVSSWYLKRIKSAVGQEISFTYFLDSQVKTYGQGSIYETRMDAQITTGTDGVSPSEGSTSCTTSQASPTRSPSKYYRVLYLDYIDFSNGRVKLNYDTREDVGNDKKITNVQVLSRAQGGGLSLFKQFDFDYSYFDGGGDQDFPGTGEGSVSKRLKLNKVTEKSGLDPNLKLAPYEFTYFEGDQYTTLPAKTSFAIDHWGYYNGRSGNTSLIPTYTLFSPSQNTNALDYYFGVLTGNQRESDPSYVKAFSLKKIKYPTCGETEFDYEAHDYDLFNSRLNDYSIGGRIAELEQKNVFPLYKIAQKGTTQDVLVDLSKAYVPRNSTTSQISIQVTCRFTNLISCGAANQSRKVYFEVLDEDKNSIGIGEYDLLAPSCSCIQRNCNNGQMMTITFSNTFPLKPGKYYWRATASDGFDFAIGDLGANFGWLQAKEPTTANSAAMGYAGGLRVKKITDYDGSRYQVRKFSYRMNADGVEKSSGRRMTLPQYSYYERKGYAYNNPVSSDRLYYYCYSLYRSSNSTIPLNASAGGSIVGYDQVKVSLGENAENGFSMFYFENNSDVVNYYGYERPPTGASVPNPRNGNLLRQEDYTSGNFKVREVINTYSSDLIKSIVWGIELREETQFGAGTVFYPKNHFVLYPSLTSTYSFLQSSTERAFDTQTGQSHEVRTDFFYDNPNHLQLTKKLVTTGKFLGSQEQRRQFTYKYPLDLAGGSVYDNMVNQFIHSPVIQEQESIETSAGQFSNVKTKYTDYRFWYGDRSDNGINYPALLQPERIRTQLGGGNTYTEIDFLSYDTRGNLTQFREKNNLTTTLDYYGPFDSGKVNLLKSQKNNLDQTTSYDYTPLAGVSRITDPNNRQTFYVYDSYSRLLEIRENSTSGNLLNSFAYKYQCSGQTGNGINVAPSISIPPNPTLSGGSGGCTPPPSLTISASATSLTSGQSVSLSTSSGCSGLIKWFEGSSSVGQGNPLSLTPAVGGHSYTAVCDVSNCVSSPSNTVSVTVTTGGTSGGSFSQCIEAESVANRTGGVLNEAGASNSAVTWNYYYSSDYVEYAFSGVPSAGTYTFKFRYATADSPTIGIIVNGGTIQSLSLPGASNWTTYGEISVTVSLQAGPNTIRVQGSGNGAFRQDRACLEGTGTGGCTAPSAPTISATTATSITLNQSVGLSASSGCTGTVKWYNGQQLLTGVTGTSVTITPPSAGTYSYAAICEVGNCQSPQSNTISVTVTSGGSTNGVTAGCYRIQGFQSNKYLQSGSSGEQVKQYSANNQNNQIWKLEDVGSGQMKISSVASTSLFWEVSGGGTGDPTPLILNSYSGASYQKFAISLVNDSYGGYRITPAHASTKGVEMGGFNTSDGGTANTWTWGPEGGNQRWRFESQTCPTTGGTTSCDFQLLAITIGDATAACGSQKNLLGLCSSGTDCSSVTNWQWSGPGFTGSGDYVTVTVPSSPGTYTYTVSAAKPGCTPKTATVNVTAQCN